MKHPEIRDTDLVWLSGLAHALVREPHAADDLVQDTVLAAARSPEPLHQPRAFLATVARRLSARRARTEARRAHRERLAAQAEQVSDSAELVERAEVAEQVARAARNLDEPFRTTVLAHYLDGASVVEIAQREGRPADTIRWRLRQGIERLRASLVRDHGRDWSEWSVLLLPLARTHERAALGLTAAAGSGGSTATTLFLFMKTQSSIALAAVLLAVVCATLWFDSSAPPAPSSTDVRDDGAARAAVVEQPAATPKVAAGPASNEPRPEPDAPAVRASAAPEPRTADMSGWTILVVDPSRQPIGNARVALVEIEPSQDADSKPKLQWRGSKRTGEDGIARFARPKIAEQFGIVADADGWLRAAVPPPLALVGEPSVPLEVVLRPGKTLRGRVLDPRGRPVPNLPLLALTAGFSVSHVSLSSVELRAQNRFRDPRNVEYQQSRATTAADGSVAFDGVPGYAELEIRSDDPTWRIVDSETVPGDAPFVTWTAKPAFGVVVRVLDAFGRRPVRARATFRVDLELADGSTRDIGQWVGKGDGTLRFSFHEGLFPTLEELDVVRAVFHGTVTTNAGTETWRAEPIQDPKLGGVAEVEALVSADALTNTAIPSSTPSLPLVLDVRSADGQPYSEPLRVSWTSTTKAANPAGDVRAELVRAGTYRTTVPVPTDIDSLALRVEPANASGSLPSWNATVPAIPDREQILNVRLPTGGHVVILRPARWISAWTVRASYRSSPEEPWQGSWNYGAREGRMILRALRPAEWRFELAQDAPARSRTLRVQVRAGDELVIGG